MAPISVLSVASEVSRFSVVLTLALLRFGPCPYSQPCPLQRGMDFRITPILGLAVTSELARFSAVRTLNLLPFGHFGSIRAFLLLYDTTPGLLSIGLDLRLLIVLALTSRVSCRLLRWHDASELLRARCAVGGQLYPRVRPITR
jgi:hypothetical protein